MDALASADLITLGPGSLFTSVLPNLLVYGIAKAIRESPAVKAYFVNLMWQPGETSDFRASDHVRAIQQHATGKIMDCAVVNVTPFSKAVRKRYAEQNALPVENDLAAIEAMGIAVRKAALLKRGPRIRHDSVATAKVAVELALEGRARRSRS